MKLIKVDRITPFKEDFVWHYNDFTFYKIDILDRIVTIKYKESSV